MLKTSLDYFRVQFGTIEDDLQRVVVKPHVGKTILPTTRRWCAVHNCAHQTNNPFIVLSEESGAVYCCPAEDGARLEAVPWTDLPHSVRQLHQHAVGCA
jgi:hypothetical protein